MDILQLAPFFPVNILGTELNPVNKVRNLGVLFDASFKFSDQVNALRRSCYYHIRDFARIRRHLPKHVAISVANALVSSRLDYCNSILESISAHDMRRLQNIQNSLCRIIFRKSRYSKDHITPYLKSLHWLPITHRIDFKWFLLIFKVINFGLPQYFIPFFTPYSCPVFTRRSVSNKMYLNSDIVPFHKVIYKSKTKFIM